MQTSAEKEKGKKKRIEEEEESKAHKASKPIGSPLPFLTRAAQDRDFKGALKPIRVL